MVGLRPGLSTFHRIIPSIPRAFPRLSTTSPSKVTLFRPATQRRFASYSPFPGRGGRQYNRFDPSSGNRFQVFWKNNQAIIYVGVTGGGTFYVLNLEEVPITHRRRFNCISPETEKTILGGGYEQVLQEFQGKVLPDSHPYSRLVAKVVEKLLPSTGGLAGEEWRVHVIDEPKEKNAFVMPGGKVFVFTGILPICRNEDGLAAVLGHEIAHNVAHHSAERLSRSLFVMLIAVVGAYIFDVSGNSSKFIADLFLTLPNSRTQEAEADHIGLLMMAQSCYNPESAVGLWQRMKESEKGAPPQFLSTHPSSGSRIDTIRGWLPEAKARYEESECGTTSRYATEFKKAFGGGSDTPAPVQLDLPTRGKRKEDDDWFW